MKKTLKILLPFLPTLIKSTYESQWNLTLISTYKPQEETSIVKTFPSTKNSTLILTSSTSPGYDLVNFNFESEEKSTTHFDFMPTIKPVFHISEDLFYLKIPGQGDFITSFENKKFRDKKIDLNLKEVYLILGHFLYGKNYENLGVVYDLRERMIVKIMEFSERLEQESCTYVFSRYSFFCVENHNERLFLEIGLSKEKSPEFFYGNFRGVKPFAYHNNSIFGCYLKLRNLNCEYFEIELNKTNSFSLDNVEFFGHEQNFKSSHLVITELKLLILSLKNRTLNFYDIEKKGDFLLNYNPDIDISITSLVFSNSSFLFNVQFGEKMVKIFQIPVNKKSPDCKIYDFLGDICLECNEKFYLSFDKKNCISENIFVMPNAYSIFKEDLIEKKEFSVKKINTFSELKFEIKLDFFKGSKAVKNFISNFEVKKNIKIFFQRDEDLNNFLDYTTEVSGKNLIILKFIFKKNFERKKVKVFLKDVLANSGIAHKKSRILQEIKFGNYTENPENKPKNSNSEETEILTSKKPTEKSFKDNPKNEKIDKKSFDILKPYYQEITIPTTIIEKEKNSSKNFFLFEILFCIKILLTIFLALKPVLGGFENQIKINWLFQILIKFEAFTIFSFISVYCLRSFDHYQIEISKIFFHGNLLKIKNENFYYKFYYGKYSEFNGEFVNFEFLDIMGIDGDFNIPQNLESKLYFLMIFIGVLIPFSERILKKISLFRITFAKIFLIHQCLWAFYNFRLIFENKILQGKNHTEKFLAYSTLVTPFIMIMDILTSFKSPEIEKDDILKIFYPDSICSFYTFSSKIVKTTSQLKLSFANVKFFSYTNFLKYPLLIFIICSSAKSQFTTTISMIIWSVFYLAITIKILKNGFENSVYLYSNIFSNSLLMTYSFLLLIFALEDKWGFLSVPLAKFFIFLIFAVYILLWVENTVLMFYILVEVTIESEFWKKAKDRERISERSEAAEHVAAVDMNMESKDREILREKFKNISDQEFWAYLKTHVSQGSKKALSLIDEEDEGKKVIPEVSDKDKQENLSFVLNASKEEILEKIEEQNNVKKDDEGGNQFNSEEEVKINDKEFGEGMDKSHEKSRDEVFVFEKSNTFNSGKRDELNFSKNEDKHRGIEISESNRKLIN